VEVCELLIGVRLLHLLSLAHLYLSRRFIAFSQGAPQHQTKKATLHAVVAGRTGHQRQMMEVGQPSRAQRPRQGDLARDNLLFPIDSYNVEPIQSTTKERNMRNELHVCVICVFPDWTLLLRPNLLGVVRFEGGERTGI
jgi:hypothetical protein